MRTLVSFLLGAVAVVCLSVSVYAEPMVLSPDGVRGDKHAEILQVKGGHGKGHPGKGRGQKGKERSQEEHGQGRASEGEQERGKNDEGDGQENNGPEATNGDEENGGQGAEEQQELKNQGKKKGLDRADEAAGKHGEHGRSKARGQR